MDHVVAIIVALPIILTVVIFVLMLWPKKPQKNDPLTDSPAEGFDEPI